MKIFLKWLQKYYTRNLTIELDMNYFSHTIIAFVPFKEFLMFHYSSKTSLENICIEFQDVLKNPFMYINSSNNFNALSRYIIKKSIKRITLNCWKGYSITKVSISLNEVFYE